MKLSTVRPQTLLMVAYLLQPIAFGSWLPRIPDVQAGLSLGTAELAIALLGLPLGILVSLPFASQLMFFFFKHCRCNNHTTTVSAQC